MSAERLTKSELAERLGESTKQITRYVAEGCPVQGTGRDQVIPWAPFRAWWKKRVQRLEREAADRDKPVDIEEARSRKLEAEAKMAELDYAIKVGSVVPLETVEATVALVCGRMLPVLQNAPSNYGLRLEELGVPPEKAEAVLESIATDLTRALQSTSDDLETTVEADEDDSRIVA